MAFNAPDGTKLGDGFCARLEFSANSTVSVWEKTIKPPGISAGGAVDTTTMLNTSWRTMSPKRLKTATEMSVKGGYDPKIKDDLIALIGVNQQITTWFPDGSKVVVWGFIDDASFDDLTEGEMPMVTLKIVPTNQNSSGAETAPDYVVPTTTTTTTSA